MFSAARLSALLVASCLFIGGCSGVPIKTMAYFANIGPRLMDADPAALSVAILHDNRLPLSPDAAPELQIRIEPRVAGAFPAVDEKMRMQPSSLSPPRAGLPTAASGLQWRLYVLSPAQAERVARIQADFLALKAKAAEKNSGGSLSIGVGMAGLVPCAGAERYDSLALESWMRMSIADGFIKIWAGRMGTLRAAAKR